MKFQRKFYRFCGKSVSFADRQFGYRKFEIFIRIPRIHLERWRRTIGHEWVICRHCHVFIDIVAGVCMPNECDFHFFPSKSWLVIFFCYSFSTPIDCHGATTTAAMMIATTPKLNQEKWKTTYKKKAEERRDLGAESEEKEQNAKCEYKFSQLFVCSQQLLIVNARSLARARSLFSFFEMIFLWVNWSNKILSIA